MQLNQMPLDDANHLKQMLRKDDSWQPPQELMDAYDWAYRKYIASDAGPMGRAWLIIVIERAERISGKDMEDDIPLPLSKPYTTKCPIEAMYEGKSYNGEYVRAYGDKHANVKLRGIDNKAFVRVPLKDIKHRIEVVA